MTQAAARLLFVAGKGGVGRTTIAAARSVQAASAGRKTLAIDATGSGDLARRLGSRPELDRLSVNTLSTVEALDHYLSLYLPLPGLNRVVGGVGPLARIFDYVANAAPGVREILVIGKIGWEALNGGWDDVVVDAPATGHLVELLDAPAAMTRLVPTGPIADQTAWLQDVLSSPSSSVELVTTPGELPVNETIELASRVANETAVSVRSLVLNRVPPEISESGYAEADEWQKSTPKASGEKLAKLVALAAEQSSTAHQQRQRLEAEFGDLPTFNVSEIVSDPQNESLIDAVAAQLDAGAAQITGESP